MCNRQILCQYASFRENQTPQNGWNGGWVGEGGGGKTERRGVVIYTDGFNRQIHKHTLRTSRKESGKKGDSGIKETQQCNRSGYRYATADRSGSFGVGREWGRGGGGEG